eukprot:3331135-Pyramimonas_sp.AAC.1
MVVRPETGISQHVPCVSRPCARERGVPTMARRHTPHAAQERGHMHSISWVGACGCIIGARHSARMPSAGVS